MNQREKISNRFSDAYLLAMLEEGNKQEVIAQFSKEFPELEQEFQANARSLDLMYSGLGVEEQPSENEIRSAYNKVSEKLDAHIPVRPAAEPERRSFFAGLKSFFSTSPTWAGATLGIGAAVIIALLWQPWVIKESMKETAKNSENQEQPKTELKEFAVQENPSSTDPTKMPEVQYRGKKENKNITSARKREQDSLDELRLKQMAEPKQLEAPSGLQIGADGAGAVKISWGAVPGALSYIVEIGENDAHFDPVTQISQSRARITHLESGKTYYIRVIAASGQRVGLPSLVKSVTIP